MGLGNRLSLVIRHGHLLMRVVYEETQPVNKVCILVDDLLTLVLLKLLELFLRADELLSAVVSSQSELFSNLLYSLENLD